MKLIRSAFFTAGLVALPLCSSFAAFDSKIVSADARWLVHVDFNLLRESEIGRELLELATRSHAANHDAPVQLDFKKALGTVGKVTAYGANFAHNPQLIDGSLVVEGTPDLRKIVEGFVAQALVSQPEQTFQIKDLPFEAYSLQGDLFIGFPKEPIILVSKVKSQLARAYDLYRGNGASMAKAASSPLRDLVPDTRDAFLVAASVVPGESVAAENAPQARLIKMAQAASLSLGEKDKATFANIKLIANSTDTAEKLEKIVQGLTAMASLAQSDNKDIEAFMKSVTVQRQNLAVRLNMSYSSESLSRMIQNMQTEHKAAADGHTDGAGTIVAKWKADRDVGSAAPDATAFAVHTIEKVYLTSGAIIRIQGQSDQGEPARIDFVEIQSTGRPGPMLKFEAEYMKLTRYFVESLPAASGGKVVSARGGVGVAELQFPGTAGDYEIKVHYLDENDGKSTYTVRVELPEGESQ